VQICLQLPECRWLIFRRTKGAGWPALCLLSPCTMGMDTHFLNQINKATTLKRFAS
jgi:hypothetical protein